MSGKHFASGARSAGRLLPALLAAAFWTAAAGAGADERVLRLADGVDLRLVWIEPGEFTMGGARPLPHEPQGPTVRVRLTRGYYLGRTEVTQAQWQAVMGSRPWAGRPHVVDDPRRPAMFFSWRQLQAFVDSLGARTGAAVRLPTEAEWEYACRAGGGTLDGSLDEHVWYHATAFAGGLRAAQPVATKRPNAWGLFDMRGNVWEWVADWYAPAYGLADTAAVAVDPRGPDSGRHRVKRGGSFTDFGASVHCGARDGYSEQGRYINIGARVLVEP